MRDASVPKPAPRAARWTFKFPASASKQPGRPVHLPFHVSLLHPPIHAWFYKDPEGRFVRVRVVGHGTSEPCRETSRALRSAQIDRAVAGLLGYGIAELAASSAGVAAGFDKRIRALHREIDDIAKRYPHEVQAIDVADDSDARFEKQPALPQADKVTVALSDRISDKEGPAFVPARSWLDGAVKPLSLEVSAAELGLDDRLFYRIAHAAAVAPWIDAVEIAKQALEDAEAYAAWVRAGAALDPSVGGIDATQAKQATTAADTRAQLQTAIDRARRVRDSATAIDRYQRALDLQLVTHDSLRGVSEGAEKVIEHNETCLQRVADGKECSYYAVEITAPPEALASLMNTLVASATTDGAQQARKLVARRRGELHRARRQLADARICVPALHKRDRETVVDALLRSWPFSTNNGVDDSAIDKIIAERVPEVWRRLLDELAGQRAEFSTGLDGGDLVGPSVFYRVTDRGNGRFAITPTYIVHGDYLERWSRTRNSVVIARTHE
ncbi:MAG TPA: hypothetical protein VGD80_12510 [Kofleriaceae bacterium]